MHVSISSRFFHISGGINSNPTFNAAPENPRPSNIDSSPPRDPGVNPNLVFGFPARDNSMYNQNPNPQLPDNRQPFPAMPNSNGFYPYNPPGYYPAPTPPPNVFGPFRNNYVTTTKEPGLLDQFLNNKRNASTINNASLNLTLFGLLFLLIYRIRNNLA